jgi:hypothetical protein
LDSAPTRCDSCGMILGALHGAAVLPALTPAEREQAYEVHLMEHHKLTSAQVQLYRAGLRELSKPPGGSRGPDHE